MTVKDVNTGTNGTAVVEPAAEVKVTPIVVVEPVVAAAAPGADPKASNGSGDPAPAAGSDEAEPANPNEAPSWAKRKLARAKDALAAANAELATLRAANARPAPAADPAASIAANAAGTEDASEAEIERRAGEKAANMAAQAAFVNASNAVFEAGKAKFGDEFVKRVPAMAAEFVADMKSDQGKSYMEYQAFVQDVLATDDAAGVMFKLASDLELADSVMQMPPRKRIAALTKMAMGAAVTESALDKPITPVGRPNSGHESTDPTKPEHAKRMSTADWMKARNADVKDKQKNGVRIW